MKILWSLILTTLLFYSPKSEVDTNIQNDTSQDKKLIKSYVVDDKSGSFYAYYVYNDDNTLKEIVFKEDGVVKCTTSFKYKNGKIVALTKQKADGSNTEKKQFEYKGNLIVKTISSCGNSSEMSEYKYDSDNFLKKITTKSTVNNYESLKTTYIEKLAGNKIKVKRENVATHVISYDDKLTPESAIPGYKPLVLIDYNGISGNILLTEIYTGFDDKPSTTITPEIKFGSDGKTVLSSKITYSSPEKDFLETQEFKYNY